MTDQSASETVPHYEGGLPQLALGGAALLVGTVNLVEARLLRGGRVALPATEWLPTVVTFAAGAYWPLRAGIRSGRMRRAAYLALVAVLVAAFVLSLAVEVAGAPFRAQVALSALYGGSVAAYAVICRIRPLAVYALLTAATAVLLSALERRGLHLGVALPLLAGCVLAGDGALRWSRHRGRRMRAPAVSSAILPGADAEALRRAARRGMEVWFEDGTPELQLGGYALATGLVAVVLGILMPGEPLALGLVLAQLLLVALVGLGVLARRWFKERWTAERGGTVQPRLSRAATAAVVVTIAVLGGLGIAWPPLFGELWHGGHRIDVRAAEQFAMPLLTGALVAAGVAWSAWVSGIRTLYQVGAIALVLGALLSLSSLRGSLGAGIVWLVAGALVAGDGALRMRRYLRGTSA